MHPVTRLILAWNRWCPPQQYFDPSAETMLTARRAAAAPLIDDLARHVRVERRATLDLGCGEGGLAVALAERGARPVLACDVSASPLARGARQAASLGAPVTFFAQDAARMALPDASVDLVFTIATFEHFPDPAAVLSECHRVLRPGGVLYASFEPYYGPAGGHVFDFIGVPWAHVWFPSRRVLEAWDHLAASNPALAAVNFTVVRTPAGLARRWLNGITVRRFGTLVAASPFETAEWRIRYIRDLPSTGPVSWLLRPFRELLTTNITAVLRKPV